MTLASALANSTLLQRLGEVRNRRSNARRSAAHIAIDQVRFGGSQCAQIVRVREGTIFHLDLFRFGQVP